MNYNEGNHGMEEDDLVLREGLRIIGPYKKGYLAVDRVGVYHVYEGREWRACDKE